jgi:hypothetical protein
MAKHGFIQFIFRCPRCESQGILLSVCANLTYLILEGFCPGCRKGVSRTYDLLRIDASLTAPDATLEKLVVASLPTAIGAADGTM